MTYVKKKTTPQTTKKTPTTNKRQQTKVQAYEETHKQQTKTKTTADMHKAKLGATQLGRNKTAGSDSSKSEQISILINPTPRPRTTNSGDTQLCFLRFKTTMVTVRQDNK